MQCRSAPSLWRLGLAAVMLTGALGGCAGRKAAPEADGGIAVVNVPAGPATTDAGPESGYPTAAPLESTDVPVDTAVSEIVSDTYDPFIEVDARQSEALNAQGPYDPTLNVRQAIADAKAKAESLGMLVLLDFGSNVCTDCRVLEQLFEAADIREMLDRRFVVVRVDLGQFDRNMDIAAEYGDVAVNGIPALVVIDAKGVVLGDTRDGRLARSFSLNASLVAEFLSAYR